MNQGWFSINFLDSCFPGFLRILPCEILGMCRQIPGQLPVCATYLIRMTPHWILPK